MLSRHPKKELGTPVPQARDIDPITATTMLQRSIPVTPEKPSASKPRHRQLPRSPPRTLNPPPLPTEHVRWQRSTTIYRSWSCKSFVDGPAS